MNRLTAVRKALITRMADVRQANGYRTEAGSNVLTGWLNELLKSEQVTCPAIVIQRRAGLAPLASPDGQAVKTYCGFSVIGCVRADLDDYDDALDDLEHDLLRCLMGGAVGHLTWAPGIGATGITIGAPEHYPPGDGEPIASVLIPVHIHTVLSATE